MFARAHSRLVALLRNRPTGQWPDRAQIVKWSCFNGVDDVVRFQARGRPVSIGVDDSIDSLAKRGAMLRAWRSLVDVGAFLNHYP